MKTLDKIFKEIDKSQRLDKTFLFLKSRVIKKARAEKEIEILNSQMKTGERIVLEYMESVKKKTILTIGLKVTTRTKRGALIKDLGTFMKWAMKNCSKEEFKDLFTPKSSELKKFVDAKYDEKTGIENVLLEIPGIEIDGQHTTLSIKEEEKDD